ncbi:uncharacterized protein F4807DRAFT_472364 [Annulohypoxylon truncatum]|uniref:uncharacterized protein n=1 Tax=Annulohypoxylon truncatum TaxID=327061 RepID=UPI0020072B9D|nr:uncharacterized protein F4807DRAFT_472364 [Annulohypoxylon truncatum]KAI1204274.1 hypothetical protein F4807DRAFT_472364 [Annulohypoxylon truncatum]
MPNYYEYIPEPVDFFAEAAATECIKEGQIRACFSLLFLIGDILSDQDVKNDYVVEFLTLMTWFRKRSRHQFSMQYILFQNIILNMIFAPNDTPNPTALDPIPLLLRLAVDTKVRDPTLGTVRPFGRRDLMPTPTPVRPYESINYNFQFHVFASTLYHYGVLRKPEFFVRAMVDALERRYRDASRLLLTLDAVHWWVMNFGFRLFKQNSNKRWVITRLVRPGSLYEEHVIRTFGGSRLRGWLTVHRWRYWKRRLEESMIDVVDIETNYLLSGPNNIARQAAEKIGRILLKNGYEV